MKSLSLTLCLLLTVIVSSYAQNSNYELPESITTSNVLKTDGLIQPHLDEFLKQCKKYNIDFSDKLFNLKEIAIVDTLKVSPSGGTLGMLVRNKEREVEKIIFSKITLLDNEILRVVAFHEFGHYFLGYKHTCKDCNSIMAEVNTSYFDIVKEWDKQVEQLFMNSPEYIKNTKSFRRVSDLELD